MSNQHAAFVGSIPENYDLYLGPCLFASYANDIAQRVTVSDKASVLEIACGTGIVTRQLRSKLPRSVRIIATDLNEAMLSYAAAKFGPDDSVEWKQADATSLPFADSSFGAVVCQFGLMFFPDKFAAVREVRRVLAPGGQYVLNVWDSLERNELAQVANNTMTRFFEDSPPTFYQVPFGLYETEVVTGMLKDAGFDAIEVSVLSKDAISPSAADITKGLIEGNPIIAEIRQRATADVETIKAAVAKAISDRFGDKPVRSNMQAMVFSAR